MNAVRTTKMILVALALTACAPRFMWVRPSTTQADFDQDVARCQYEAASATATYGSSSPTARTTGGAIGQGIGAGIGAAMKENELVTLCMRAKGYAQQPVR